MAEEQDVIRDLAALPVPLAGALQETGDPWEPYRIVDAGGEPVAAVAEFFRDLQAAGRSEATLRSYGHDLLRWFRFLWAVEVPWNRATRIEARDFCRWMLVAGKPSRPHWRSPGHDVRGERESVRAVGAGAQRDGAALLLPVPPGGGQRPGDQPVPAGPDAAGRPGARPSQPDGAVPP